MASVEKVREALETAAQALLARPQMMVRTGGEAEILLWHLIDMLEVVDERAVEGFQELRERHGKLGFTGPFRALFAERTTYLAEIVSIAAQAFAMQGCFRPGATVAAEEWPAFVDRFGGCLEDADVRRATLRHDCGTPSFSVTTNEGDWDAIVDGFMCAGDPFAWVFFDYWIEHDRRRYRPASAAPEPFAPAEDGWLRNVRLPSRRWEDGLVLTAFGKHLRWGADWHLWHARTDPFPAGVGDQLRSFEAGDPSRSLRRNPPG